MKGKLPKHSLFKSYINQISLTTDISEENEVIYRRIYVSDVIYWDDDVVTEFSHFRKMCSLEIWYVAGIREILPNFIILTYWELKFEKLTT